MDKTPRYTNFLNDIRELCLFHSVVINGKFQCYDDLMDIVYEIDSENKKIIPVKIIYAGDDDSLKKFKNIKN